MTAETVEERARLTHGASAPAIYAAVRALVDERSLNGGTLIDVGCGTGSLRAYLRGHYDRYFGADAVRHPGFPADAEFVRVDLDRGRVDLPDGSGDLVACVETIEHVENPRALLRELVRLVRSGGSIIVTTPNQLSLSSKLALLLKNEFVAFQERPGLYPAHITALLEVDLLRIFRESGLLNVLIRYSGEGRIPLSARSFPRPFCARHGGWGRAFSDNILAVGKKP